MIEKIFKVAQVRDLLNQVYNDKITFSRFVEILNENANKTSEYELYKRLKDKYESKTSV